MVAETAELAEQRIWEELGRISDPEIPAISLVDLGVIGSVSVFPDRARVELLPTFVGCPAIEVMRSEVSERIGALGLTHRVDVEITFDPPWTSERITPAGRERLRRSGFAPPHLGPSVPSAAAGLDELAILPIAECPYCRSRNTTLENPFGPTLCRAIYHCANCRQPFEQMKRV
ncbi:MAG TPA: 1,2-phenylacetyl-CoA epoxidase subunit PaaD [Candidatus Limnocylindria bacterium]